MCLAYSGEDADPLWEDKTLSIFPLGQVPSSPWAAQQGHFTACGGWVQASSKVDMGQLSQSTWRNNPEIFKS